MKFIVIAAALVAVACAGPVSSRALIEAGIAGAAPVVGVEPAPAPVVEETTVPEVAPKPRVSLIININPAALENNLVSIGGSHPAAPVATPVPEAVSVVEASPEVVVVETAPETVSVVEVAPVPEPISVVDTAPQPEVIAVGVPTIPEAITVVEPVPEPISVVDTAPQPEVIAVGVPTIPEAITVVDTAPESVSVVDTAPVPEVISVVDTAPVPEVVAIVDTVPETIQVVEQAPVDADVAVVAPSIDGTEEVVATEPEQSIVNNYFVNVILNFLQGGSGEPLTIQPVAFPSPSAGLIAPRA